MLRCTGEVVRTTVKSGTAKATGNPYRIRSARILVGRADFCDVQLGDDAPDLREGDDVDLAVTYGGEFRGQPTFHVAGPWATAVAA